MEVVETPNARTMEEVAAFFHKSVNEFVKTLIYTVDGKTIDVYKRQQSQNPGQSVCSPDREAQSGWTDHEVHDELHSRYLRRVRSMEVAIRYVC